MLRTRIQLNPRTLPALGAGRNDLVYKAGPAIVRRAITSAPSHVANARYVSDGAQGYWVPAAEGTGEFTFRLPGPMVGFEAGGRFLDLSSGLAPDKFTAEVRKVTALPATHAEAAIAWSKSPDGPFQTIWEYDPHLKWRDGIAIDRTLRWPEVDRHIAVSAAEIYVRYRIRDLAIDNFRLAVETNGRGESAIDVTHVWRENETAKRRTQRIPAGSGSYQYVVEIPSGVKVVNEAIIFECK